MDVDSRFDSTLLLSLLSLNTFPSQPISSKGREI